MKREVAFFKDRRARTVLALVDAMRAVGMTDDEIRAELNKMIAEQAARAADESAASDCAQVQDRSLDAP